MKQRLCAAPIGLLGFLMLWMPGRAQSITGFSTIIESGFCPPGTVLPPKPPSQPPVFSPGKGPVYCTQANWINRFATIQSTTSEDYIAALYYNVENVQAAYYGSSPTPLNYQDTGSVNGTASNLGTYSYASGTQDGIYSQATNHILNFYYYVADGGYYDPFGYSTLTNGDDDGVYQSGYWLFVNAYGAYIAEASVLLGETLSVLNHNTPTTTNTGQSTSRTYSVLWQVFIPPNNVQAPYTPPPYCNTSYMGLPLGIFQGDNRGASPTLGSYRGFQQATVGLGGYCAAYLFNRF